MTTYFMRKHVNIRITVQFIYKHRRIHCLYSDVSSVGQPPITKLLAKWNHIVVIAHTTQQIAFIWTLF